MIIFYVFSNSCKVCPLPYTQGLSKYYRNHERKHKVEEYFDDKENFVFLTKVQIDPLWDEILLFALILSSKRRDGL